MLDSLLVAAFEDLQTPTHVEIVHSLLSFGAGTKSDGPRTLASIQIEIGQAAVAHRVLLCWRFSSQRLLCMTVLATEFISQHSAQLSRLEQLLTVAPDIQSIRSNGVLYLKHTSNSYWDDSGPQLTALRTGRYIPHPLGPQSICCMVRTLSWLVLASLCELGANLRFWIEPRA